MTLPLPPHGGLNRLTTRTVSDAEAKKLKKQNEKAPKIVVTDADLSTVRRFGDGALTPLEGPMTKAVFNEVLDNERIVVNGKNYAWGIPLSLPVTDAEAKKLKVGKNALIVDERGKAVAVLEVEDIFAWDKKHYNTKVYGTERSDHPGARIALTDPRSTLVGGKIHVLPFTYDRKDLVQKHVFTPDETRKKLKKSGWDSAIAFQTRNPLHRAHEYAMVYAVEKLTSEGKKAGVVLNPLVGETKGDDVPASIRMQSYENLKKHRLLGQGDSLPKIWKKAGYELNDVFDLYALDMKMFYGGPREAIMHAIYRQNYGFSNIVIG
ncbi:MAG: sulfate adenylyltransferase, partial [Candidatus Sumerlaeota bacterium]